MSRPNEKFRRRAAKTDISDLFDDLPELDDDEIVEETKKSESNSAQVNSTPSEPKKVVTVDTAGSDLFDDLPPIKIADGEIKDVIPENVQRSAFAMDGQGDVELSDEGSLDPEEERKRKLAQIMARRKRKKDSSADDEEV